MKASLILFSFVSLSAISSAVAAQATSGVSASAPAAGANSNSPSGVGEAAGNEMQEIVVTAQKRSERLQDVPLSINAATGDQLKTSGITNTDQLAKLVPGFTSERTAYGNPVYFIRGIGFNDTTLGVSPAVSIYTDQQPLPFTPMARGAILDLERVEVLKGPQGTLFGENSTGGAINYIAAKPTTDFHAGVDLSYARFNETDVEFFVSGPLTDTLSARVAVRSETSSDWQYNYANGGTLGAKRFINSRGSVKWEPSDRVSLLLTASGWKDNSDTQQPQLTAFTPLQSGPTARQLPFPISTFPTAPRDAQAAAWEPGYSYRRDDWFYQFTGDLQADLTDGIHLAALTSYAQYRQSVPTDTSGTPYPAFRTVDNGNIETFSQELRLNGEISDRIKWLVGGNYEWDKVDERLIVDPFATTGAHVGPFNFDSAYVDNNQDIETKSVFDSVDYKIAEKLTLQGAIRYTAQDRHHIGCSRDTGDGTLATAIGFLSTILTGVSQTIAPGACALLDINTGEPVPIANGSLDQNNVSYRVSLNWEPVRDALLYANITKGYKAGSFPTSPSTTTRQIEPIGQESVLAYEVGTKLGLIRKLTIDAAAFYYDYQDKQLSGYIDDPVYGPLPTLVAIPKTHVEGVEGAIAMGPFSGLSLTFNATYLHSRIDQNPIDPTGPYGNPTSFLGQSFPLTPAFQSVADVQYRFQASSNVMAYFGGSVTARTSTTAALLSYAPAVAAEEALLHVPGYALLDLRAGIESPTSVWRLEFWGRNITNKFYNIGTTALADYSLRFTGMPATYGVSLGYRF